MKYADDLSRVFQEERRRRAELRETIMDTVKLLVQVGESKDPSLIGHGARIARYVHVIARRLGWNEEKVAEAVLAGLLHDVGNVAVDSSVLTKVGNLNDREWAQVQAHAEVGARLLGGIEFLKPLVPYVQHHHERFDGHGYPQGLRGRAIPAESRLIASAEAVELLLRPGRARISVAEAQHAIRREAGRLLDPEMAATAIQALAAGDLTVGLEGGR
jgi:HD-GYP domain-containing protein (c-di-GMP phosphodiesterase class II)